MQKRIAGLFKVLLRNIDILRFVEGTFSIACIFRNATEKVHNDVNIPWNMLNLHLKLIEKLNPSTLMCGEVFLRKYRNHGLAIHEESEFSPCKQMIIGFEDVYHC